jgi:hypothetical protein
MEKGGLVPIRVRTFCMQDAVTPPLLRQARAGQQVADGRARVPPALQLQIAALLSQPSERLLSPAGTLRHRAIMQSSFYATNGRRVRSIRRHLVAAWRSSHT